MLLRTRRLEVRPVQEGDLDGIAALLEPAEVHVPLGWSQAPAAERVELWIASKRAAWAAAEELALAVLEDDVVVAIVGVHGLEGPIAAVSYGVRLDRQRVGIGTEAMEAVLAELPALGVSAIEARVEPGNAASVALAEGLGFEERPPEPDRWVFRYAVPRPAALYARQHAIWSAWSETEGDAASVAAAWDRWAEGEEALDLGCGVGRELCALAARGWEGRGVDAAEALVHRARERAARLGVSDRVAFEAGDLLRGAVEEDSVDLLTLWDSTLAIWRPPVQRRVLRRWVEALAPGGTLVVGQLCRERYAAEGPQAVVLRGDGVGPGSTRRRYAWEPEDEVLVDEVVWTAPDGTRERLPDQRLHLLAAGELRAMLEGVGLDPVRVVGADGWRWTEAGRDPSEGASWQLAAVGRQRSSP